MRIFTPAPEREEEQIHELPAGHGELIMVVDDEESIRLITKATLEAFDYCAVASRYLLSRRLPS